MIFAYAMTRVGEAQHAVRIQENGHAERKTLCGRKVATAYSAGSIEPGKPIQHPWRCDTCSRKVEAAA